MTALGSWRFEDGILIVGRRMPPVDEAWFAPLNDLLAELGHSVSQMDRFLDVWRTKCDPAHAIVGNSTAVRIEGDQVRLEPLYEGQWDDKPVTVPLVLVEEMFEQYRAWLLSDPA